MINVTMTVRMSQGDSEVKCATGGESEGVGLRVGMTVGCGVDVGVGVGTCMRSRVSGSLCPTSIHIRYLSNASPSVPMLESNVISRCCMRL